MMKRCQHSDWEDIRSAGTGLFDSQSQLFLKSAVQDPCDVIEYLLPFRKIQ